MTDVVGAAQKLITRVLEVLLDDDVMNPAQTNATRDEKTSGTVGAAGDLKVHATTYSSIHGTIKSVFK